MPKGRCHQNAPMEEVGIWTNAGNRYTVIIFTNQGGIKLDKGGAKLDTFKLKAATVLANLDVPLTLYAATENDKYRKPRTGMWVEMLDDYDIDIHGLNMEDSILVGDAAGRDGDFSASDRFSAASPPGGFYYLLISSIER